MPAHLCLNLCTQVRKERLERAICSAALCDGEPRVAAKAKLFLTDFKLSPEGGGGEKERGAEAGSDSGEGDMVSEEESEKEEGNWNMIIMSSGALGLPPNKVQKYLCSACKLPKTKLCNCVCAKCKQPKRGENKCWCGQQEKGPAVAGADEDVSKNIDAECKVCMHTPKVRLH